MLAVGAGATAVVAPVVAVAGSVAVGAGEAVVVGDVVAVGAGDVVAVGVAVGVDELVGAGFVGFAEVVLVLPASAGALRTDTAAALARSTVRRR
jgi:hypothetical protein